MFTKMNENFLIEINYSIKSLHLSCNDFEPEFYFFTSHQNGIESNIVIKDALEENKIMISVISMLSQIPFDFSLCIDLYVKIENDDGTKCRTRVGSSTYPLFHLIKLYMNEKNEIPINLYDIRKCNIVSTLLINNIVGVDTFYKMFEKLNDRTMNNKLTNSTIEKYQNCFNNYVVEQMDPFVNSDIIPSDPFLQNVHAPYFNSRLLRLPGSTFFIIKDTHIIKEKESFFKYLINVCLERYCISEDSFIEIINSQLESNDTSVHENFEKVCTIIVESACSYINRYPYISDFTHDEEGNRIFCESFDNIFTREAGDCEDSAKGIYTLLKLFSTYNFESEIMKSVKKVCSIYVPTCALGSVCNPSIRTISNQNNLAHMFCLFIPLAYFLKLLNRYRTLNKLHGIPFEDISHGITFKPWMESLNIFNAEGTGRVDPRIVYNKNFDLNSSCCKFEKQIFETTLPIQCEAMIKPVIDSTQKKFYKKISHLYTDLLYNNGYGLLSFSLIDENNFLGVQYERFVIKDSSIKFIYPHKEVSSSLRNMINDVLCFEMPSKITNDKIYENTEEEKEIVFKNINEEKINIISSDIYVPINNFYDIRKELFDILKNELDVNRLKMYGEYGDTYRIRIFR